MNPDPVSGTEENTPERVWIEADVSPLPGGWWIKPVAADGSRGSVSMSVQSVRRQAEPSSAVQRDNAVLAAENARLRQQRDAPPVLAPDTRVLLDGDERDWFVANVETLGDGVAHAVLLNAANGPLLRPASPPEWPLSQDPTPVDAPSTTTPEPSETSTEGARGHTYPHQSGDHTVLGPQIFATTAEPTDDTLINWLGANFVRQQDPRVVVGDQVIGEAAPAEPRAQTVLNLKVHRDNERVWRQRAERDRDSLRLELATMTRDRDEARGVIERFTAGVEALADELGLIPRGYTVLNRLRALLRSTTPERSQP